MPTTEWLNKYESVKEKLACKTDLDAHFTEKMIGNMGVDVLDIGSVHFPTGTIFACDPLVELEDTPPFIQTIPAGTYPVKICVVPSEKYGDRYACVKVEVSGEKPVRYELGMTGKEDLDEELGEDEYFGFGVDAGMGCVADIQTQAAFGHTGPSGWRKTQTSTPTTTCSATYWRKNAKGPPQVSEQLRRLAQLGGAGHRLQSARFRLWLGGTATIRSTSAMTQGARSAPCMCASSTLKPVTRSRRKEGNSDGMAETGADSGLGKRCPYLRQREAI